MATIFNPSQPEGQPPKKRKPRQRKQPQNGVCSPCGRTECFVRPRFFSGQLLTDEDLALAQRYAIEKNKLHNRYLVGSGVVCGLAVRCHPCEGYVMVEPGYAIDCCGNDIVVSKPQPFPVIDHLKQLRRKQEVICEESRDLSRQVDCTEKQAQEYYLVISYHEEHTKPVSALMRDNGCHVSRCEPSRTCEYFELDLVKKNSDKNPLNFWDEYKKCDSSSDLSELVESNKQILTEIKGGNFSNHEGMHAGFNQLAQVIVETYYTNLDIRCNLCDKVSGILKKLPANPPNPNNEEEIGGYQATVTEVWNELEKIKKEAERDCQCNALLMPCSDCKESYVVLASLKIENGKISKICNNARQQVVSGPMLQYFLPNLGRNPINFLINRLGIQPLQLWMQGIYAAVGNRSKDFCCSAKEGQQKLPSFLLTQPLDNLSVMNISEARREGLNSIINNFPNSSELHRAAINFGQGSKDDAVTLLEIYNRSETDEGVRRLLTDKGIESNIVEVPLRVAEDPNNLASASWVIPRGSAVDLLVNQGRIVGARVRQGGES